MNYTQNHKIAQVTESTLVVGVDIGSERHYARAFDWRGLELTRKAFPFSNSLEGYQRFEQWVTELQDTKEKDVVLVGCEPTGHYWFTFGDYVQSKGMKLVFVNPYHVKQSKEMDDNSPKKTDQKDPKTIAKLVVEGRYVYPYIPTGVYAELRAAMDSRERILKELGATANRIQRWLKIHFPEYLSVYKQFHTVSGLMVLEQAPFPQDVIALGVDGVNRIWREAKLRSVGKKRAATLVEAAHNSIGRPGGRCSRTELLLLLEDYRTKRQQLEAITAVLEEEVRKIPHVDKLLAIKGIGIVTVAGFLSETGDITRFTSSKQIQKLGGLEIKESSSGKHKGRSSISKRGRKRLRKSLFQGVLPLIRSNAEFRSVYEYYTTRIKNPLKSKQAMIAVACKLIRVFYAILTKGTAYDASKLTADIIRPQLPAA